MQTVHQVIGKYILVLYFIQLRERKVRTKEMKRGERVKGREREQKKKLFTKQRIVLQDT